MSIPLLNIWAKQVRKFLSMEPKASAQLAREICGPDIILMGGADVAEVLYLKEPETVRRECRKFIAQFGQSSGHPINHRIYIHACAH